MYKVLKQTINKEIDMNAPDIFSELKNKPVHRIESEQELFSELNKKDEENVKSCRGHNVYCTYRNVLGACAAVLMFILVFCGSAVLRNRTTDYVILDINPSICIELTNDHKVKSVYALNQDGKKIVSGITEEETLSTVLEKIILEMNQEQYFDGSRTPLLISHCYKKNSPVLDSEIQNELNRICLDNDLQVAVIYQKFHKDKVSDKKAKQQGVSVGKYTFVQSLEEKYHVDGRALYTANMKEIIQKLEQENIDIYNDQSFDVVVNNAQSSETVCPTTTETETVAEHGTSAIQTEVSENCSEDNTDIEEDDEKGDGKEPKEDKKAKKDKNSENGGKQETTEGTEEFGPADVTEVGTTEGNNENATTETDTMDIGSSENPTTETVTTENISTETNVSEDSTEENAGTEDADTGEDAIEGELINTTEYRSTEEIPDGLIEISLSDMFFVVPIF